MNSVLSRSLMFAFLLTLVTCGVMCAQTAVTGAITGYISDNSGAAVTDATVTATNPDTKVSSTSKTNADGVYRFQIIR